MISWFLALACLSGSLPAAVVVNPGPKMLFDADFNSPGDTPNQQAKTSVPANDEGVFEHPSRQIFGSTRVVESYKTMTGQPAMLFAGTAGGFYYGQLGFDTQRFYNDSDPSGTRVIEFQFDLLLENLAGGSSVPNTNGSQDLLTLLIDSPDSHRIEFTGSNVIYFRLSSTSNIRLGSYLESIPQHYSVINYLDQNRMEVWQDRKRIYSGQFHSPYPARPTDPVSISSYRISLTDSVSFSTTPVAVIDNVSIRFVPEPGVPLLLAPATAALLTLRRRKA